MVISIQDFVDVESLVLLHLLFHQVLHDAGVEVLAGLFVRDMVLLWIVKKGFAVLVLIEGRCFGGGPPSVTQARILRVTLPIVCCFVHGLATNCRVVLCTCLSGWTSNWYLIDEDHLR